MALVKHIDLLNHWDAQISDVLLHELDLIKPC